MKAYSMGISKADFVKEIKDTTTIKRAEKYLKKLGWQVFDIKHDSANGPDLTIEKNGRTFRVEVKKVLIGKRACNVKAVNKKAKNCEAIALLLPNDKVVLQPMKEHIKLCSKYGFRGVTDLVRLNS